mgnify:CR=1 FL=1
MFDYYGKEQEKSNRIYTNKIIFKGHDLYSLDKNKIFEIISKYSNLSPREAYKDFSHIIENDDEQYSFNDIGLTLWFEDNKLIDVCVNKPIVEKSVQPQPQPQPRPPQ